MHRYADGELSRPAGRRQACSSSSRNVAITQRDGLGHVTPVVEQGPGQFLAEIAALSNRPVLVDGRAEGVVETLLIPPDGVRALLVAEAELGERLVRAATLPTPCRDI